MNHENNDNMTIPKTTTATMIIETTIMWMNNDQQNLRKPNESTNDDDWDWVRGKKVKRACF